MELFTYTTFCGFLASTGVGFQIQCYQCEEFRLNDDCSSPEFIANCTVNVQDMCLKEVIVKSDEECLPAHCVPRSCQTPWHRVNLRSWFWRKSVRLAIWIGQGECSAGRQSVIGFCMMLSERTGHIIWILEVKGIVSLIQC
ncbi:uncharacterized protein LOC119962056 isoform X2 [Scyliorhinus canicula]|uniref:uncharacterized protein LOC119962056 isoform X2 n=1 Tax=Scyliorhinus canicula TaxID=7830 RepID=UPI0018F29872|nr:uncharacterized protein LOC119962056 isoform X2 [Scyliorhinus canicula]